jgi:type I restriction enzyme S subunit
MMGGGNIPQLRFSEFKGEWEKVKFGAISDLKAGYAFSSNLMLTQESKFQIIKMSNVYMNELRLDRSPSYWTEIDDKLREFMLKKGDSVLTLTGTVNKTDYGYSVIIDENNKYLLNQRLLRIREKKNITLNKFLHLIISNKRFLFSFFKEAKGGTGNQANVGTEDIKDIVVLIPSLSEQQKIAYFFTAIDQKISQIKLKKTLLEHYKKGVMQKIFSQEIRFKDENGNEFPKWERKRLGEVLIEHKTVNSDNRFGEVFSVAKHKGVINQIEHLGRSFSAKDISNYKVINPHDIVYTKSPTSDFPFGIIKQNLLDRSGVVSPLYGVFKPETNALGFLLHNFFLSWINTYNYLNPLVQKGAKNTMNINNVDFLNGAKIPLPVSEVEQAKISNFLSAIDDKINHTQKQIEKAEVWKKGLMQQMFV